MSIEETARTVAKALLEGAVYWEQSDSCSFIDYDKFRCQYCRNSCPESEGKDGVEHRDDCPVVAAKELLTA